MKGQVSSSHLGLTRLNTSCLVRFTWKPRIQLLCRFPGRTLEFFVTCSPSEGGKRSCCLARAGFLSRVLAQPRYLLSLVRLMPMPMRQALENTTDIPASFGVNAAPPFRPAPG